SVTELAIGLRSGDPREPSFPSRHIAQEIDEPRDELHRVENVGLELWDGALARAPELPADGAFLLHPAGDMDPCLRAGTRLRLLHALLDDGVRDAGGEAGRGRARDGIAG